MEKNKSFHQIGLLLFFIFPLGLYFMWKYSSWNNTAKIIITGLFGLLIMVSIISSKLYYPSSKSSPQIKGAEINNPNLSPTTPPDVISDYDKQAVVKKVVDGDTVTVIINGSDETIRIIGINSPESVDPRKSVECFGIKASSKAKEMLSNQKVKLEKDESQGERDKYGRLLRYVWLDKEAIDFGAYMIQEGFAYEYTYNTPYKYQTKYRELQKEAEKNKKGLWADDACIDQMDDKSTHLNPQKPAIKTNNDSVPLQRSAFSSTDKDCKDFSTQSEAQEYFDSRGGSSINNVDRLDGSDHDGVVCESLP